MKKVLLMAAALGLTTACGLFETEKRGKKSEENEPDIAGNWTSNCIKSPGLGVPMARAEYSFNAIGDFDKTENFYAGETCDSPIVTGIVSGTYDAKGKHPDNDDVKMINLTVDEVFVTANTDEGVETLNRIKFCGKDNWEVGEDVEVTGEDCGPYSFNKGDVVYDVYDVKEEDKLYFGKSLALTEEEEDPAERPKDINTNVVFIQED
jgi:hypothetical protein